jgi:hypothetical protein
MKRILILFGLIITLGLFVTSCYKDVILPEAAVDPDGPPQFVSYSTDLAPLFNSSCALSGCHINGGPHKPYMNTDISWQQIVNGGFVDLNFPKNSKLYIEINGDMRDHIPSAKDRQKVYDWIRNGAPNN